jgi:Tol biopolymer transport system component/beta-lactamase regulating signal transducer with metallopeptidase domain
VIVLVLIVQFLFQKRLSPRWRCWLWSLVLVRLLLPVSPGSPFSIFNYAPAVKMVGRGLAARSKREQAASTVSTKNAAALPTISDSSKAEGSSVPANSDVTQVGEVATSVSVESPAASPAASPSSDAAQMKSAPSLLVSKDALLRKRWSWPLILSFLWLGGVLFLLARIIWIPLRLNARLAQYETATGSAVFEILEQSKRLIGMRKVLPIVQSRAVASPALLGFIRPWLLLPDGMIGKFTAEELRFVFLHELAHLKRRDIAINWLMTLLQILHWFNPLVWVAFSRLRVDRELACDELALSFAKAGENKSYGQAIIKLLEGFSRPAVLPGLVGILEDTQQMKRRIKMIAQFKKVTNWSAGAVTLLLTLGIVTLTDAQVDSRKSVSTDGKPRMEASIKFLRGMQGTLSPDETKIAYADWDNTKSADIIVKDLEAGKEWKITSSDTNTPGVYEFAVDASVWSPDSKSIAYGWYAGGARPELRIASVSGDSVRVLRGYDPQIEHFPVDWSKDGRHILCQSKKQDGTAALTMISVDTSEVREMLSFPWDERAQHPRFSPDAKFITYAAKQNGNRDIYVLDSTSREVKRLTDWQSEESSPIWSPGGKTVLFSSNRSGTWELLGVEVRNGNAVEDPVVIRSDFGDRSKRITQSGKLMFELLLGGGTDVYSIAVNPGTGETAPPTRITRSLFGRHFRNAWSADGKKLAFLRKNASDDGAPRLCVMSLADGREESFETGMRYVNTVFLSPDGKAAALAPSGPGGAVGIHLYNFDTGKLRPILLTDDFSPTGFSRDGKEFLLYQRGSRNENVAVDLTTGKERKVPFTEKVENDYDLSPDGSRIVYVTTEPETKRPQLVLADREFKSRQAIVTPGAGADCKLARPRWSLDGTKITYNQTQRGKTELHIRAADGKWERTVDTGKLELIYWPEWSPDSTTLALTLAEPGVSEIGLLENFLPNEKITRAGTTTSTENNGVPVVRTLVSGTDQATSGVLSPDESQVAYTDFSDVAGDLTVKNLKTGTTNKLTSHDSTRTNDVYVLAMNLAWSPDSKWIAYTYLNDTNFSLRLAPAAGGQSKVLKENFELLYWPFDWSPDGKSILCNVQKSWDKSMALGIVSTETGEVRQLLSLEWNGLNHARFSPDGKFIVYDREINENRDIFVLALDAMRVRQLTDFPSSESTPVWSSDGKHVLFTSNRTAEHDLWAVAVRNGEAADSPFLIKRGLGAEEYRTIQNGKLAFTTSGGPAKDCYYFEVNPVTEEIGQAPKLITTSFYGRQICPAFSPDGQKVAYIRPLNQLCIQSLAGSKVEVIKPDMQYFNVIFWSPDGKTIALQGRGRTGPLGIHLLSLETRKVTQLLAAQDGIGNPRGFTEDGREFLFNRDGKHVAVNVTTGKERTVELPSHVADVRDYNYSPDGARVVYVERAKDGPEQRLIVADSNFTNPKIIARSDGQFRNRRWSPNGKMIAYNYTPKKGLQEWGTELQVIAADGSWRKTPQTGKLKIFSEGFPPSWSPDGTKLALTLTEPGPGEIGVLENFLPKEKTVAAK